MNNPELVKLDIELCTRTLAKSWGVVLPEHATFSVAMLLLIERLYVQQANLVQQYQQIAAEQNKFAAKLREKPR